MPFTPDLSAILPPESFSTREVDLVAYGRDCWPRTTIRATAGLAPSPLPQAVVWPSTSQEVAQVLAWAQAQRVPVVPFGAGSGVCGGTWPMEGGLILDMKRMDHIEAVDRTNMMVLIQAGALGERLERELQLLGLTLGHFPSSMACSTLGGWIAARSAGQLSSRYGKIEDMVVRLEAALPSGEIIWTGTAGAWPLDLAPLLVGSEGTLAVVTRAWLKVHAVPERVAMRGLRFPDLSLGLNAMARVMQSDLQPAVLRLYDPFDTLMAGSSTKKQPQGHGLVADLFPDELMPALKKLLPPMVKGLLPSMTRQALSRALAHPTLLNRMVGLLPKSCLCILGFEGSVEGVRSQEEEALEIMTGAGGTDLGPGPGEHWLQRRYAISFKLPKIFDLGAMADTMEVATTWDRLPVLYDKVRTALGRHAFVMAHFSHAYPEGCSIYFTFAVQAGSPAEAEEVYDRIWHDGMDAVSKAGGALSHHHGVGRLKAHHLARELGEGLALFSHLKALLDPQGVMNPGKLVARAGEGS